MDRQEGRQQPQGAGAATWALGRQGDSPALAGALPGRAVGVSAASGRGQRGCCGSSPRPGRLPLGARTSDSRLPATPLLPPGPSATRPWPGRCCRCCRRSCWPPQASAASCCCASLLAMSGSRPPSRYLLARGAPAGRWARLLPRGCPQPPPALCSRPAGWNPGSARSAPDQRGGIPVPCAPLLA